MMCGAGRGGPGGVGPAGRSAAARRGWPGTRSGGHLGRRAESRRRVVTGTETVAGGSRGPDGRGRAARCH